MPRYTGYIRFSTGDREEIDVDAVNEVEARRLIQEELQHDYEPAERLLSLTERRGFYL